MIPHVQPFKQAYKFKEPIYLPPLPTGIKKTLIFDIDETMIHCLEDDRYTPDVTIKIPLDDEGEEYADAGINIRPHLYECLKQANENYQVVAFTASD